MLYRIFFRKAGVAKAALRIGGYFAQTLKAEKAQTVGAYNIAHLAVGVIAREKIGF